MLLSILILGFAGSRIAEAQVKSDAVCLSNWTDTSVSRGFLSSSILGGVDIKMTCHSYLTQRDKVHVWLWRT